jgi:hypothetical protein
MFNPIYRPNDFEFIKYQDLHLWVKNLYKNKLLSYKNSYFGNNFYFLMIKFKSLSRNLGYKRNLWSTYVSRWSFFKTQIRLSSGIQNRGTHSSVVEHSTADREVSGSNPLGSYFFFYWPQVIVVNCLIFVFTKKDIF